MSVSASDLARAAACLRAARRLAVFTGAGVSAESGIDTFRDAGGLWQAFPPEQFARWGGLVRTALVQPRRLAGFVLRVLQPIAVARPNAAHRAIAQAEHFVEIAVVTQNVDGLHQDAGSTIVREIHGSLFKVVTLRRRFVRLLARRDLARLTERLERATRSWVALPRLLLALRPLAGLGWRGIVRPSAVLFGEGLVQPDWNQALDDARRCDVMLVIGTSGVVLPAALLPVEAHASGARVIVIDPDEPATADVWLAGTACDVVPRLFALAFGVNDGAA